MISEIEGYYLNKEEPIKSYLLAMRKYILDFDELMTETWTHRMPMFRYKGKLFCYLWTDKKSHEPYIGMYKGLELKHPKLDLGNRKKMKTMTLDPEADLPIEDLETIFKAAVRLYK